MRNQEGLSQEDVAKAVHVTRQSVSKWESGDSNPDLATTVKIAELFDVSLDYLVLDIKPKETKDISNKKLLAKLQEMNEENNEHSLGSFLEDNGFLIVIVIACVYACFHGGINYWWHKFF